ncbi:tonB dependent receptor family protein [Lysobacter antibioticus]|uniref:Carboxypeptidase regulatory-like domain protein n=1 Tax=Lysobacter antibioticus TaxID=84531 RepID=A0A0S2DUH3_LYSAN|nr:TonB-dependent receptor [Lysobacter antibioticus]ALN62087.1 tonB dependent receptor family protein [Lysobacter antibioticus]ALN80571.1 carboxypeptidase regulatory-like domain protein [Lysobacter antibioticus]
MNPHHSRRSSYKSENKSDSSRPSRSLLACALASCLAMAAPIAFAQGTAATIRGVVSGNAGPAANASVTATNLANGLTRKVQTGADGNYTLAGLPPGTYRIDVSADGQSNTRNVTVAVGQAATLNVSTGGVAEAAPSGEATDLDKVTVTSTALVETRTSEIATYVSNKQIAALPQASRNFLAFADIVPGVQFKTGTEGSTSLRSGAQLSNGINVYVDGVGQKDYVLKGGITGQDSSRGNPFPQLGIAEYKVITSNYKAEYDQLSSAAITAVTKSGGNEFHGSFFWDHTSDQWNAKTVREEKGEVPKAQSKEEQYGASFSGPLIQDRMHFFVTYEAKEYNSPRAITPGRNFRIDQLPAPFQEMARQSISAPFKEDLYFGKIDWAPGDAHLIELTTKYRKEDELTNIGGARLAEYGTLKAGEETRVDLRYQYSAADWINDAHITYEDVTFGPRPATLSNGFNLRVPRQGQETRNNPEMEEVLNFGGGGDFQDKGQKGYAFQNDFTWNGWEGHTVKAGLKYKAIDITAMEKQPYTPQYRYDIRNFATPYEVRFSGSATGFPPAVKSKNKQFGIYLQDDWEVNEHLTLNLGLRWDYETTPSYEDFVTPANLVAALNAYPNIHNANVDYDINDYISTGNNRKAFKDGWQPRLGFSYDLNGDERHVIFGGAGRSYNRNQFDYLSFERYRLAFQQITYQFNSPNHTCTVTPTGNCFNFDPSFNDPATLAALALQRPNAGNEVFLLNNDLKTPYSDQFSLGMRNAFAMFGHDWNSSATLLHIRSHDGILFTLGNRLPNGNFYPPGVSFGSPPFGQNLPGFGNFFIGNNAVETRLNSLLLSLDKPFTEESGWGVSLAYTYSDAKENRNNSDIFAFDYPNLDDVGFTRALGISKHRLVATGIMDFYGMTLSGKLTLASPEAEESLNCITNGPNHCYFQPYTPGDTIGFKQFDLALQKEWDTGTDFKFWVRGDVLNVFNWRNYIDFDTFRGVVGNPNERLGERRDNIALPTRSFKLSMGFNW